MISITQPVPPEYARHTARSAECHRPSAYIQATLLPTHLAPNDLPPSAEGRLYHHLLAEGWTKVRISRHHGAGHPRINNRLTIHRLPPQIRTMYDEGHLPLMSADAFVDIENEDDRLALARLLAGRGLPLARIEALAALVAAGGIAALLDRALPAANGNGNGAGAGAGSPSAGLGAANWPLAGLVPTGRRTSMDAVHAAIARVCDGCSVQGLADACDQCPLTEFMATLTAAQAESHSSTDGPTERTNP